MIDKVTWMFNCHSTMWLWKYQYAYDYKMTMHNDVDKYLQLTWNVMIYIIHHFVFSCMGVILGIFGEVWHAITWTTWQLMTLQWLQNDYKSFDMDVDKPTPHLLTYLPIYLPTNPPTYLPTYLYTHQPTYTPTHTPTYYLPTHLLTYYILAYPPTYLPTHSPTYLLLISYLLQLVYYLPHSLVMIWNKHVQ